MQEPQSPRLKERKGDLKKELSKLDKILDGQEAQKLYRALGRIVTHHVEAAKVESEPIK